MKKILLRERKSPRFQGYDYSSPGYYFVTTCVKDHKNFFGEILTDEMRLNTFGKIVKDCWYDLKRHYPHIDLDYYCIMPNHFHGIIIINDIPVEEGLRPSSTMHGLTEIIRAFKSFSSRRISEINTSGQKFIWQRSFYDRIIRNDYELSRIRRYIEQNPMKWDIEKNFPENIDL